MASAASVSLSGCGWPGCSGWLLGGQDADLDEVVGEDPVSAPGAGPVDAGEFGAVPSVASFEVVDSPFAPCPPFDLGAKRLSVFELPSGGAGLAGPGNSDVANAQAVQ